ncbi:hypothetical protein EYS09_26015, partial [Streptomyces kasugaensis]
MTDDPTRSSSGSPAITTEPTAVVSDGRAATADRPAESSGPAETLFSGTYAAASSSFAAVMFLTGLAALAVVPTLPTAARDLDGV